MKRFQLLFMALVTVSLMHAVEIPFQTVTYNIYYHCAFINENAATATVAFSDNGGTFNALLSGKTVDIGGRHYCVNDTLVSSFTSISADRPATENVQYIAGYYRKPHVGQPIFSSDPSTYIGTDGRGTLSADAATMECVSLTADMLCMFYYAKTFDFSNLPVGEPVDVPINMDYGGQRTLQINYQGTTDYNGRNVYKMIANFTYDGGLSSYPITVMIDTAMRVPVAFIADIAIGHVQMEYAY